MGMPNAPVDLDRVAERYRELLELGRDYGVVPVLEFWGMSPALGRLSQALYVALASDQRDACVLADVFHMYKSGGGFQGLRLLGPETLALVHVNDYPADPPRAHITDAERVYPGDGVAPYGQLLADLTAIGFHGPLSIELFNPAYYAQEARTVATTALAKLRALVEG
jgi:sugar phosphate isomerase/epimerase